ncbi:uncharacterized protein TNCV_1024281 [Trichonephila clavipes]|nr:uncharacterized protein TNCV_1024281 [Trichonephila clavipes]
MVSWEYLWPTLRCRRVAGVSPLLSIGWWYLSSVSPKRHCCRVSAADKGCRVYPLDPRPDAVALYSGCTSEARKLILPQISQTYSQATKSSITTTTTQTDDSITKIVCPPLKLLQPLTAVSKPTMPFKIPILTKSSASTEAQLLHQPHLLRQLHHPNLNHLFLLLLLLPMHLSPQGAHLL